MCSPLMPKRQEVRAKTHVSPQASILHWEAGLKPLHVREVGIVIIIIIILTVTEILFVILIHER